MVLLPISRYFILPIASSAQNHNDPKAFRAKGIDPKGTAPKSGTYNFDRQRALDLLKDMPPQSQ